MTFTLNRGYAKLHQGTVLLLGLIIYNCDK
jgi:hypothetical protein